jgi:hypothetical protein
MNDEFRMDFRTNEYSTDRQNRVLRWIQLFSISGRVVNLRSSSISQHVLNKAKDVRGNEIISAFRRIRVRCEGKELGKGLAVTSLVPSDRSCGNFQIGAFFISRAKERHTRDHNHDASVNGRCNRLTVVAQNGAVYIRINQWHLVHSQNPACKDTHQTLAKTGERPILLTSQTLGFRSKRLWKRLCRAAGGCVAVDQRASCMYGEMSYLCTLSQIHSNKRSNQVIV